jgi:hypothetical protein
MAAPRLTRSGLHFADFLVARLLWQVQPARRNLIGSLHCIRVIVRMSLFEQLGGEPKLRAIVDDFVDRCFDDVQDTLRALITKDPDSNCEG